METPTRRQFSIATATTLTGAAAYLALTPERALAVEFGSIDIPDKDYATGDASRIDAITARVTAEYEYSVNRNPKAIEFRLRAGTTASNSQTIHTEELSEAFTQTDSGVVTMEADILQSSWLDRSAILPQSDGEVKQTTVYVAVVMTLFDSAGDELGSASADASPTLNVTQESLSFSGSVSGSGELVVSEGE